MIEHAPTQKIAYKNELLTVNCNFVNLPQGNVTINDNGRIDLALSGDLQGLKIYYWIKPVKTPKGYAYKFKGSDGKEGYILIESRPWLSSLADCANAARDEVDKVIRNHDRQLEDIVNAPFKIREKELVEQIPADCLRVDIKWTWLDQPIPNYRFNGLDLPSSIVSMLGYGAPHIDGGHHSLAVACAKKCDIEKALKDHAEKIKKSKVESAVKEKELTETKVPESAIKDYIRYGGNAAKAWDTEDESAWASINKWSRFIEVQSLASDASVQKIVVKMQESAREDMAQDY